MYKIVIICIALFATLEMCTATTNDIDTVSTFVMQFGRKWLNAKPSHVVIVLSAKNRFKIKFARKTISVIKRTIDNTYVSIITNITNVESKGNQTELWWFPFEIEDSDNYCFALSNLYGNTIRNKYLLFFVNSTKNPNFLSKCTIHFDSNVVVYYKNTNVNASSDVVFEEIYKIVETEEVMRKTVLARYAMHTQSMEFVALDIPLWKRRRNLQGIQFSGLYTLAPPYISNINTPEGHPVGFFVDIMNYLGSQLNFTIKSTVSNQPLNYTYITQAVATGNYDIGYAPFILNLHRSLMVDFSYGIMPVFLSLFYPRDPVELSVGVYIKSFQADAWQSLILYLLLLVAGFVLTNGIWKHFMNGGRTRQYKFMLLKQTPSILLSALNFTFRSIIGKRLGAEPNWFSSKFAFFNLVLAGFIFVSLYRAMLVAFIAVEIDGPPVESFKHLISSKYHLAIQRDTAMANVFLNAKHGTIEEKIYQSNKTVIFEGHVNKFIDQMVRGKKPNIILWYIFQEAQFSPEYPCNFSHVERYSSKQSMGMLYKKKWAYTNFLNYHLLKMTESGMRNRLLQPYLKRTQQTCPTHQIIRPVLQKPKPVSVSTTFFLYLIIAAGICSAFIVLFIEKLCYKYVHHAHCL